jgi:hypothetical protein
MLYPNGSHHHLPIEFADHVYPRASGFGGNHYRSDRGMRRAVLLRNSSRAQKGVGFV